MLPRADMSSREVNSEGHDLIKLTGGQSNLGLFPRQLEKKWFCNFLSSSAPSSQGSEAGMSDTGQIIHVWYLLSSTVLQPLFSENTQLFLTFSLHTSESLGLPIISDQEYGFWSNLDNYKVKTGFIPVYFSIFIIIIIFWFYNFYYNINSIWSLCHYILYISGL